MYSASKPSELAFRDHIESIASKDPRVDIRFHVTRNDGPEAESWDGVTSRIDEKALAEAIGDGISPSEILTFVCGIPAMTDDLIAICQNKLMLPADRVRFEKWW